MTQQPEFDFDHALPAGVRFFSLPFLAATWSCEDSHVQALVDTGALRTVVDLRGAGRTKQMLRIPREAVTAFLDARKSDAAAISEPDRMSFDEIIPPTQDFYRSFQISRILRCTCNHVVNLIDEGSLPRAVNLQAGSRSMWSVARYDFVTFLNARRLA